MTFSPLRLLAVVVFSLLLALPSLAFSWKQVKHQGVNYVPLSQVKSFYEFGTYKQSGRKLILSNQKRGGVRMELSPGGQKVLMNGVKFIFSHKIALINGQYHVSITDLLKLIHPVMRPDEIKNARRFDTVVIDAGHGGKDAGAVNRLGTEAGYNLIVAKLLQKRLLKMGFKVVMTRTDNRFLSLKERVNIANRYNNAIFLSIHFNAVSKGASQARGIETFTLSPIGVAHYGRGLKSSDFDARRGNYQDGANIALATTIHWGTIQKLKKRGMRVPDRGIRRARYTVLTGLKHPGILFEGGFLSHPTERRLIHSKAYQTTLADAMASAIKIYHKATGATKSGRTARRTP